jgi:YD repeat-containing protein
VVEGGGLTLPQTRYVIVSGPAAYTALTDVDPTTLATVVQTFAATPDALMRQVDADAASAFRVQADARQSATFAAKWQPLTVYAAGFPVLSPNNDLVTAKTAHTSGASFTAANWDLVPTFALANPTLAVTYNGDGSVATTTENGILTTFTYNTDGTVNSQTRAGVTKTFTYGVYGVTGAA